MITSEDQLEDALSAPSPSLAEDLAAADGDIVVLGAGGKMGPSLCRMARRALDAAGRTATRVYAVSRWSSSATAKQLHKDNIEVVPADLTTAGGLSGAPDAANVIYMVGAKFGTSSAPYQAWMTNTVLAADAARRYRGARIVAFSTGNVYPLVPTSSGGCREGDPVGPVGEYALSCLGRERVLEAISRQTATPMVLLRLNYAVELRYGVLADLALKVRAGRPVELATGYVNVVWQRYANEVALRCLRHVSVPPRVLNVTGPEVASVRSVAAQFAERFNIGAIFEGTERSTALLSNASRCHELFGYPDATLDTLIDWVADWIEEGGSTWDKPTKFEQRDGQF